MFGRNNLVFVSVIVVAIFMGSAVYAAPKIDFDSSDKKFPLIISGETVEIDYTVKNAGDSELRIIEVKPTCGCSSSKLEKNTLAPGEETQITLSFNSTHYQGMVTKSAIVISNDPKMEKARITFSGEVKPIAEVDPLPLNFGTLKENQVVTKTITIKPAIPEKFEIVKTQVKGGHVEVLSCTKTINDGSQYELKIKIDPKNDVGRIYERVYVFYGEKRNENIVIGVFGNVEEK